MNSIAVQVIQYLKDLNIPFDRLEHAPTGSIEDCMPIAEQMNAVIAKNYFLATRNKKNIYLCLVRPEARFQSSIVSAELGSSRLSFGSEDILHEYLNTYPGAVTPLGLIFDRTHSVRLVMDPELLKVERIAFHPCDNTITVAMTMRDFLDIYLPAVGYTYVQVEFSSGILI